MSDDPVLASSPPDEPAPPNLAPATVWIVEDNETQGQALRQSLASEYSVRLFNSGATMLEALASQGSPDLLLIDWYMPEMSGGDVCRFIRTSLDGLALPILVLTASGSEEDLVEGIAAGANDFVRKPFSDSELKARIEGLLRTSRLYAALERTKNELQIEVEFRERFMGILAHDLRQPLNTIVMATNVLAGKAGAADGGTDFVRMQRRAADRMVRMVSQLLDVTRTRPETGLPIQRAACDLTSIVTSTLEEMRIANPKSVLMLRAEPSIVGHWDADRLAQVCTNLVCNAIEHGSSTEPVEIEVSRTNEGAELRVRNRGEPLDQELLTSFLQPFRRVREAKRKTGGVGLGLHIVDQIARAHGGSVALHSASGVTEIVVRLPLT